LVIGRIADTLGRGVEGVAGAVHETFFEPVIRLGVTGLARSGKTVFITSLVANLLERGRMTGLEAARSGRIEAAFLQPQPDDTVPRFAFEDHLADMTGAEPRWPESTRAVSELRLSLRVRPSGLLGAVSGQRTVHLDIVDYPGEWLLDLALLDLDFEAWSRSALERAETRRDGIAAPWFAALAGTDPQAKLDEPAAAALAGGWTDYLAGARAEGLADCTPGRFLLPGDLEGSPALTFAPLPPGPAPRGSLAREFARRYEAYKAQVVKPFFRAHFARIDRQVVLVDALGAIHSGPQALEDLRRAMASILGAFRPGRNSFLTAILGKRVDRILLAATKADHLHHEQHPRLQRVIEALLADARRRADFEGAQTRAMAIASLRATVEETRRVNGVEMGLVRGRLLENGRQAALHPGDLPEDPSVLLNPAREGAEKWLADEFGVMRFAPAPMSLRTGEGPPHIRLDRAAEFLFGDRL
jgi:hypothetical protein